MWLMRRTPFRGMRLNLKCSDLLEMLIIYYYSFVENMIVFVVFVVIVYNVYSLLIGCQASVDGMAHLWVNVPQRIVCIRVSVCLLFLQTFWKESHDEWPVK